MPGSESGGSTRARMGSPLARILGQGQGHMSSTADVGHHEGAQEAEDRQNGVLGRRNDPSPSRGSFSSSYNQKTPARSFFQTLLHESHHAAIDVTKNNNKGVREDTAELASWALSDIASEHSPSRQPNSSLSRRKSDSHPGSQLEEDLNRQDSYGSTRPAVIEEVSEPSSTSSSHKSGPRSALTEMLRNSPPTEEESDDSDVDEEIATYGVNPVTIAKGIISQPNEQTPLLRKRSAYGVVKDIESQKTSTKPPSDSLNMAMRQCKAHTEQVLRVVTHPKSWNRHDIWNYGFRQPGSYIPPVILGLLLNILDALSYGMILFPLGNPVFAGLGPDGISMFYISCIVSQLTFSLGGSTFKGAVGSEMIEVVPFFHMMAFKIEHRVGSENPEAILATTLVAYNLSSIMTGLAFGILGKCHLGSLIGFFPRHILLGCIGGVGFFLVATGVEVSARLDDNLNYNLETLQTLFQLDTLAHWGFPLCLAILLKVAKHWATHPLTDAGYFLSIIWIFYFFVVAIPELKMPELRERGWVFEAPEAGVPFYHFYTMYKFELVDVKALASTVPAMLALTFFGLLHVPINIPALGLSTGEDDLDIDRELKAHGISNALSGCCGSIQNYLVYTNTLLFMRSGGDSRVAGVMLAAATFGIMVCGPVIIGFIPVMVVGALIFYLGIDLMWEALVPTFKKVHRLEYITIVVIVITMGVWDFVIGILVGIVLACLNFVLQTSRVSAIRGRSYGGVANSTVRRHPVQQRFLEQAGKQLLVMKLAGFLYFGTIRDVEAQIRLLLEETSKTRPIRFLVLDFYNVDGVDYSAAETFTLIYRILNKKGVQLVICGVNQESEAGKALRNVGLFEEVDGIEFSQSLNSALWYCENELLKTFYAQRDAEAETESTPAFQEVPRAENMHAQFLPDTISVSPRRLHLHQVATETLSEQNPAPPSKWQDYDQPQKLILQTFSTVSEKPEEFWYRVVPYFIRRAYKKDTVLYNSGEESDAFYMLEDGLLKARYDLPQGKYSEVIVAGTTCGELPFFSDTVRTSTTFAITDCIAWILDRQKWQALQKSEPDISQELLKLSLKLTTERFENVTKYMLLTSG